jgi:ABC-type transport system substrate-binding protein
LTVPGCDVAEGAAISHQIQDIIHNDAVYDFVYEDARTVVASAKLENFIPYPWGTNPASEWTIGEYPPGAVN